MKMLMAGAALLLSASTLHAQQIEWKQVQNTPKGLNLPQGIQLDILGITLGESFDEVKPKFEKLLAEVQPASKPAPPQNRVLSEAEIEMNVIANREAINRQSSYQAHGGTGPAHVQESETVINYPVPGGNIQAKYVSVLTLVRATAGSGPRPIRDRIEARFSAPSSGRQLYAVTRSLTYYEQSDQPRVSELMNRIVAKLRMQPQVLAGVGTVIYRFQFHNGQSVSPAGATFSSCSAQQAEGFSSASLRSINASGNCDVVFNVEVRHGISRDHAQLISFSLGDNERLKANLGTDYAYMQNYVRELLGRSRGAPPKL